MPRWCYCLKWLWELEFESDGMFFGRFSESIDRLISWVPRSEFGVQCRQHVTLVPVGIWLQPVQHCVTDSLLYYLWTQLLAAAKDCRLSVLMALGYWHWLHQEMILSWHLDKCCISAWVIDFHSTTIVLRKFKKKSPHWSKRALLLQIKDAWNERLFTGKLCYREEEEEGSTLKEFRVQKRMSGTFLENHSEVTASISRSTIKP